MLRADLEKYRDIVSRIKVLETDNVSDVVKGSSSEFPFVTHPIKLEGIHSDKKTTEELKRLYEQKHAIDKYIDNIFNIRARNLIDLHYRKGMNWVAIATKTGYSEDANRVFLQRFFKCA